MRAVDEDEVGLAARRETADIAAPERPGAPHRGGVEHVRRAGVAGILGDDPGEVRDQAHLVEHVVRVDVGADAHVDARLEVAPEMVERDAAAGEDRRAVGDRGAALGQAAHVRARAVPVGPGVVVQEDPVTHDGPLGEHAEVVEPLDRRHPAAAGDLVELRQRLRRVRVEAQVAPHRLGVSVPQQLRRAGIDLRRAEHAEQAPARVPSRGLDLGERLLQAALARRRVPLVLDAVAVPGQPAPRPEHRGDADPQARGAEEVEPALARQGEIADGGDARERQLGERHPVGGAGTLRVGP